MNISYCPHCPHCPIFTPLIPGLVKIDAKTLVIISRYLLQASALENQECIIGTLLGSISEDGSEIEIHNSYKVPYKDNATEIIVDGDFYKILYHLYQKIYPDDVIVGWFSTSPKLDIFSGNINYAYCSNFQSLGIDYYSPIHLMIQQTQDDEDSTLLPTIKTFTSTPIGFHSRKTGCHTYVFNSIPNKVYYNELEEFGVDQDHKSQTQKYFSYKATPKTTNSSSSNMNEPFKKVDLYFVSKQDHVKKVISDEIKGDDKFGKSLLSKLNSIPPISKSY